jgi:hypothetical protein
MPCLCLDAFCISHSTNHFQVSSKSQLKWRACGLFGRAVVNEKGREQIRAFSLHVPIPIDFINISQTDIKMSFTYFLPCISYILNRQFSYKLCSYLACLVLPKFVSQYRHVLFVLRTGKNGFYRFFDLPW